MKEKQINNKIRKVFLDELPRTKSGKINWKKSIGYIVHFIYDNIEGNLEIINLKRIDNNSYLTVRYNNYDYNIRTGTFKECELKCLLKIKTEEYKIEIGQAFKDNKRDITIIDRKIEIDSNNHKWKLYLYHCNKDGYEDWSKEANLLNGSGCIVCCNQKAILGINTIWDTDKWMIPIINDEKFCKTHTHSCSDKIYPTCPDCNEKKYTETMIGDIFNKKGISCPKCGDKIKYPNKFMGVLLESFGIEFKREKRFKWCKYLFKEKPRQGSYDFYIPSLNLIIEMDGGFHYQDNNMSGQTAEESKYIDNEKDRLANEHGIEVIRIDCDYYIFGNRFEYIKQNILNNEGMNKLFDLSVIDWNILQTSVEKSLIKETWDLWNNGKSINEISILKNLSEGTIREYLKIGSKLKLCTYNSKNIKGHKNNNRKSVEIFKNGISLGVFPSVYELSKNSEKLFKEKLNDSNIFAVCVGRRKTYKGYTFKYI